MYDKFTIAAEYSGLFFLELFIAIIFSAFNPMPDNKRKKYLFLSLGVLSILTMFHGSSVGKDSENYVIIFNRIADNDLKTFLSRTSIEKGFVVLCKGLSYIKRDAQLLFMFTGFFAYYSIGRFLYKNTLAPGIACILIVPLNIFDYFISTQRQGIAFAIMLFGFEYLKENKTFKFVICTTLAFFFHNSTVVFILIYLLMRSRFFNIKKMNSVFYLKWIFMMIIVSVAFQKLWDLALLIFPKYAYYEGSELVDGEPRLAVFLRICVFGILYIVSILYSDDETKESDDYHLINMMTLLNLTFVVLSMNATAINRFCKCFSMYPPAHFSLSLSNSTNLTNGKKSIDLNKNRITLLLISIMAFYLYGLVIEVLKTPEWYTTYPFSFYR